MVETSTQMIFLYQGIQATQLEQDVISELESILGQSVGLDDDLVSEGGIDSFGIMQMFAYF